MAKITIKICDCCGQRINENNYMNMTVRAIKEGKQFRYPNVYVCLDCFKKMNVPIYPIKEEVKE